MAEETEDASKAVPRMIMLSIAVNGLMAFIFIITYVSVNLKVQFGLLLSSAD